jgi:hypothetical protein
MGNSSITLTGPTDDLKMITAWLTESARRKHRRGYPNVCWDMESVQPSARDYITRDTVAVVSITPTTTASTVVLSYKILDPQGEIKFGSETIVTATANTTQVKTVPLVEGFLLYMGVTIYKGGTLIERGDTFVQVALAYTPATRAPVYRLLLSDYVSTTYAAGWPEGTIRTNVEGPGLLTTFAVNNPAAGADWSVTFSAGNRIWIHAISAVLVTSAAAGNRQPVFSVTNPAGKVVWNLGSVSAQVASKTGSYNLGEGGSIGVDVGGNYIIPMPTEMLLEQQSTIASTTANIQAGDQWSGINILFETWIEV